MKKSSTDTCCLTLPLKLEKWQEDRLAKRFEIARQLYNTLVHAELKRLVQIKRTACGSGQTAGVIQRAAEKFENGRVYGLFLYYRYGKILQALP